MIVKEKFTKPVLEIVSFEAEDIIRTSTPGLDIGDNPETTPNLP